MSSCSLAPLSTDKHLLVSKYLYTNLTPCSGEVASGQASIEWEEEVNSKTSLKIYRMSKKNIQEDPIYDNTPASVILFQARTNTLPLEDRKRHENKSTVCKLCQEETEDIEHFIMKCKKLTEPRSQITALQQPYGYRSEETLKEFLFNAEQGQVEMEMKKEWLYKLWSSRKRILNKQMDEHH